MMESHPGGRVTACSVRCSILEYLMEMMVIFISPLGSVSLGGFQLPEEIGMVSPIMPCLYSESGSEEEVECD
ncbi:hypothetical protein F2Q69_00007905 [Brassica cretica]|uniref:Uncharacterized protein n=1 Tax=Brassica cretica TaxID=69181 RepID=A0A8S9P8F3_BRACR|nr:hypothetical protein F2Q69_00007905 [Brassica cretica]